MKKISLLFVMLILSTTIAFATDPGQEGGGGDAQEMRVSDIRNDILKWIIEGGSKGLDFQNLTTLEEYNAKMIEVLQPKKVVVAFVAKDSETDAELRVNVDSIPKTCRGFRSQVTKELKIICNIDRFKGTSESAQYKLIHHEYAGLVQLEKNVGAASDYFLSEQLTDYLQALMVLRLNVKKTNLEEPTKNKFDQLLELYNQGQSVVNDQFNNLDKKILAGRCFMVENKEAARATAVAFDVIPPIPTAGPAFPSSSTVKAAFFHYRGGDPRAFDNTSYDQITTEKYWKKLYEEQRVVMYTQTEIDKLFKPLKPLDGTLAVLDFYNLNFNQSRSTDYYYSMKYINGYFVAKYFKKRINSRGRDTAKNPIEMMCYYFPAKN